MGDGAVERILLLGAGHGGPVGRGLVPDPEALVALALLVAAAATDEVALAAGLELELDREAVAVFGDELRRLHLAETVLAIEGERDCVEDRRLARAVLAADGDEATTREVGDGLLAVAHPARHADAEGDHASPSVSVFARSSCTSAISASRSSSGICCSSR